LKSSPKKAEAAAAPTATAPKHNRKVLNEMFDSNIHHTAQAPLSEKVICLDWRPCNRNTLRGFAKIKIPAWGLILDGVAVHTKEDKSWAQLPARPQIDKDGNVIREDDGKIRYAKMIEFDDKRKAWEFSDEVVAAVGRKVAAQ
jgi:hypothetical protein